MKVYRVRASYENPKTEKEIYAWVEIGSEKDKVWIDLTDNFDGKPFPKKWRPLLFRWIHPERPRPDFLSFDNKILLCNERVVHALKDCLVSSGEFLPVRIDKEPGSFYVHNIDRCINALDPTKSQWKSVTADWKRLLKPVFRADRLGKENLFKLREDYGLKIYCVERTGNPDDREFKALVDVHRFTGLEFELVWTDESTRKPTKEKPVGHRNARVEPVVRKDSSASDRPLTANEEKELQMLVTSGYKHLRLDPKKSSVLQVQKAIRQTIDKLLLSGKRLPKDKTIDLGTSLGAAWGHAFCKALKWNWRVVTRGGKTLLTITPPDRAYIIGPIGFVTQQLQKNPPEVNTSLLLFQMAKAGSLAKAQAGAYLHIG